MENTYSKEYRQLLGKLLCARTEVGLSQKEVAVLLDKPQSYVSKCESGERRIDVIELKRFSDIYKREINYFTE